jgi:hypothetical protein
MRSRCRHGRALVALLLLCLAAGAQTAPSVAPPADSPVTIPAFRAQLQAIREQVRAVAGHPDDAAALSDSVPPTVHVQAGDSEYTVSLLWLRVDLDELPHVQPDKQKGKVDAMLAQLDELDRELAGYDRAADLTPARAQLKDILARREFRNSKGQSWVNRLGQKVMTWLARLLGRAFSRVGDLGWLSRLLVVLIALGAVGLLGYWIQKLVFRAVKEDRLALDGDAEIPSSRSWQSWLADAQRASTAGQWREAIRLCYWAGISRLESGGAWPPDRARTPREYLALMPAVHIERPSLQELTRTFELAWYAQMPVSQADFAAALATAERLGCR